VSDARRGDKRHEEWQVGEEDTQAGLGSIVVKVSLCLGFREYRGASDDASNEDEGAEKQEDGEERAARCRDEGDGEDQGKERS
jgi:hypothetical protein